MTRHRFLTAIAAGAFAIAGLGACSAESLTEFGLEQVIEAQGGGDIDLDFTDGGFDISTEDGDFSLDFDAEDGTIVFGGDAGDGVIQFDDDGNIQFDTDHGSGSIDVTDSGTIQFDTDHGSGSIDVTDTGFVVNTDGSDEPALSITTDGTGTTTMTTADVSTVSSQTVPGDWPDWLGAPATLDAGNSHFSVAYDGAETGYIASISYDPSEPFVETLSARLEAAGFSEVGATVTAATGGYRQWEADDAYIGVTWEPGAVFLIGSVS